MQPPVTRRYQVVSEPRGPAYEGLLRFCSVVAQRCSLDEYKARASNDFLARIDAFQVERIATASTARAGKLGKTVARRMYRITPEFLSILGESARGLYSWQRPKLPANLTFYRNGGEELVDTIAALRIGWLYLTETEAQSDLLRGIEMREWLY